MVTTRHDLAAVAAADDARSGLHVEPHFTSSGVHPYEEVEWETRDAIITDFRTGDIAFEQRGVEFPKKWSLNATTIVAQKYFRGTLGTPERERSVKHMIDRVADTITDWGRTGRYFADDASAATFNAELKHLLVHQKAAFNSPVWFNVGVEPEPQCSACQPWDAPVSTPDGLVPIGHLVESNAVGTKVFDAHGITRIVAVKANGRKEVLRLHLKAGSHLDVTADHLVWKAASRGRSRFVEAGTLKPGDCLQWHRTYSHGGGEITQEAIAEAALAGWLQSDGFVPEQLFSAPLPVVAAYLRSVFQAEGYVSTRKRSARIGLDMISERLVRGVQSLLSRFGIFSRVRFKQDARPNRHGCWSLSISNQGDRAAFHEEIGFIDPVKAKKLEATLEMEGNAARSTKKLQIERIELLGSQEVYDIQTESGEYLSGNLRVHNCFILSVEDTMSSILNWYVEEGTIFKGGSGSGVNLSRIRSSREQLRGGGQASGPVSFMRGADASAGTIKCLHRDTDVVTDRGVMRIADVRHGDRVLTRHGFQAVRAVHDNGTRDLVRVRTSLGDEILCTPDHRFWVRGADGEGWREAKDLRADDHVMIDLGATDFGSPQTLTPVAQRHHNEIEHDLPEVLDEAFALWLGWVYGDGSITWRDSSKFIAVQVGDEDPELVDRYTTLVRTVFGERAHVFVNRHGDRPDASASVRLCSSQVIRFLEANGLRKGKAADLRVPERIKSSPAAVRAAFLAGVFEADGHVGNGYPWMSSVSPKFAQDIHRLLLSIGIPSTIGTVADRSGAFGTHPMSTVRIVGGVGVARFAKLVGFISERKSRAIEAAVERFPRELSLTLGEFAGGHAMYVPVTVELAGEGPTFDLTVAGVHEYLVHNVVTHNSGGKTRRAAKMVILDVDHPDVEEFIWCKQREELKARALREAGFDMDLDGLDSASVQYQNANNSVRVTDDFMRAVEQGRDWELKAVTTGETIKPLPAADLMRQIARAAWECADPGMQYDTTINDWHTTPNAGRINGSNPCFTGDSLVHTDKGLIRFDALIARVNAGESFGVYTHDATNAESPAERVELTTPDAFMITGRNPIVRLRFSNGMELRCTPTHKVFTTNRGYVAAADLTEADRVKVLNVATPAVGADWALPIATDAASYRSKGDHARPVRIPEKWSTELGHYLGWLIGDGSVPGNVIATIYGGAEEQTEILPRHRDLLAWLDDDHAPEPSVQSNGTAQLRLSRRPLAKFFAELGVREERAPRKRVPEHLFGAPREVVAAFLAGLFDADGCAVDQESNGTHCVGLGSASEQLLGDVQRLFASFGIFSRVYRTADESEDGHVSYERADGSRAISPRAAAYQLRISGRSLRTFAAEIGFSLPSKAARLERMVAQHQAYSTDETVRLVSRTDDGFELTYNLSEPRNHSYLVNGVVVRNCSEYMHLDNSACNLASLNLRKFEQGGEFDVASFRRAVEIVFTAQEILVSNSSYPTAAIGVNARAYRQLGLGYANLGGLLMSLGIPYDSDDGRAWAAAITALMTGQAYRTSVELAKVQGPFDGYEADRDGMLRVLRKHRDAMHGADEQRAPATVFSAAKAVWDDTVEEASAHGVRNAQASVLAPTGCLVGGSLVPTERGLVRLQSLGDPAGPQLQDLDLQVATDEGPRAATQFYVNGVESIATVETGRGYRIQGTAQHRIKVATREGEWVWKRLGDVTSEDVVPLALHHLVGDPQTVSLPPLAEAYWTGERHATAPRVMTPELAELIGYFMGDGSLHARGIRLCVANDDFDVAEHLARLGKELFGLEAQVAERTGDTELAFHSVRLAAWWEACGFAKREPRPDHRGKGWLPHIPDAVLHANDPEVYAAFVRGLFEADGTVAAGYPSWSTTSRDFSQDVQSLLLALGYPTTRRFDTPGWGDEPLSVLRVLNSSYHERWLDEIGFIGHRKHHRVERKQSQQSARHDHIPVSRALVDRVAPENDRLRQASLLRLSRTGMVSRTVATELYERSGDPVLGRLLQFFYDRVDRVELGEDELTYDLSVPDNVTYVANGFVSHNTIGLMMDCDTTGIEPDLGLVKMKKLVGGGSMKIVNRTVPAALENLGYQPEQVEAIVDYIDEHGTVEGAPAFRVEHLPVFDCAMGERSIAPVGHVRMMAAVQPWLSGAISKCVTADTRITTADGLVRIGDLRRDEVPDSFRDEVLEVASQGGTAKTDAFYYGGERAVRRVVLRSGHTVTGTENHRVQVAGADGLEWRYLDELQSGEYVAVQYGSELWSDIPADLTAFRPSPPRGSQKHVAVPVEMSEELAFLLGAYASEGHCTRSNWTVVITNADEAVLQRIAGAWQRVFGVNARITRQPGKCPGVVVSSKTIVEFFDHLGCGDRASNKRIPDAVLRSPRDMVLAFLQGLFLDAYAAVVTMPKLAICLDSGGLLDDLQAVLTNLGVVHGRVSKYNAEYDKYFDEVYAVGAHAGRLARLVPFLEPEKAARARKLTTEASVHATADGVTLPGWMQALLDDGLHFSPVAAIEDAGVQEVFDLSVPTTHAFVGNGIVNHNTVNLPESASVEDVEHVYMEGWRLGLKALAIYRDNCKVAQPLSLSKKASKPAVATDEEAAQAGMVRRRLPRKRPAQTFSFTVGDAEGYMTAGEYPGDGLGEIFVNLGKQGSTLSGVMDAFAISVSIGLQYGVPLEAFVSKFINMRFEPAGMTDDAEVKFASSIVDYMFRRLAIDYLPAETRHAMSIYTMQERTAQIDAAPPSATPVDEPTPKADAEGQIVLPVERELPVDDNYSNAPMCYQCGVSMVRAGSCHCCPQCGTTSGCS